MYKLLVILFIIKLYARKYNNIFQQKNSKNRYCPGMPNSHLFVYTRRPCKF